MFSKNKLKKMFLEVLYQIQYGSMKGHASGTDSIVSAWINEYYDVKLTDDEIQLVQEAIQELKTSGIISKDATQMYDVFQVLTTKGKKIVEEQKDPDIHGISLDQVISSSNLLSACLSLFNDDEYEHAIFSAFKLIEEEVRKKSVLDPSFFGVNLITKALHPSNGKLQIPSCILASEQEGVYNLFKGAIAFFKNPSSHRTVNYDNRLIAMEIIGLADLLLQILATAQVKV